MSKQIVEQVKAELVARGQKWETNEDAFQITGRVAWLLRDRGARLISKNAGQNGANTPFGRVSHDAIAFPSGWKDILVSAGPELNVNGPAWDATGSSSATQILPWDMDAALPVNPSTPPPAPPVVTEPAVPTPVPSDLAVRLDAIEAALVRLAEGFRLIAEIVTLDQQESVYEIPYDFNLSFLGRVKGTAVATPRKK